jgi:glutamate-ammonia-ligase adenylyltransferase
VRSTISGLTPLEQIRRDLRGAADPDDASRRLDRLEAAGLGNPALSVAGEDARYLARIACADAPYLGSLATRDVARLLRAATDPYLRREKPAPVLRAELFTHLQGVTHHDELSARLRAFRAQEYLRLGARELGLGDRQEVGRELAHLADAALDAAIDFHQTELRRTFGEPLYTDENGAIQTASFVVLGMGKLGGEELNFSSDIDLLYAYTSDNGQTTGPTVLSLHEYFDKLGRRVTRTLDEVTWDDMVFRVDLRLRPEGARGPLVNSLLSLERYYESFGRPWERQAWLKARPSAGSLELGEQVLSTLTPFVYPRTVGEGVVGEVLELNRRIKAELGSGATFDVKTGRGGIREIEFFVQALELVHAGKDPRLRVRSTRRALDQLFAVGLITGREKRALSHAYDFLRHVEHLLQLDSGRQTHRLPETAPALEVLAKRLRLASRDAFEDLLLRHTRAVAALFGTLGAPLALRPEIAVLLDPSRREEEHRAALATLGFAEVDSALFELEMLRQKPASPLCPRADAATARVAPALLEEIAASPDPDQALCYAVDLVSRRALGLWPLLAENRPLLRLLVSLFGTSAFLARGFVDHPELIDTLLLASYAAASKSPAELERALAERLAGLTEEDVAWNTLRRFQHEELLRIGLADLAGDLDGTTVSAELSALADVCVARTFERVHQERARALGPLSPMVVLALGTLGARELSYASDLDLVFFYDGGVDAHEAVTKVAQRLCHALSAWLEEGRLYDVDTRLRPSGKKGTLVSSLAGFHKYHEESARLWERQALIKARVVAGDPALALRVSSEITRIVYETPRGPGVAAEIAAMRERMEKELARGAPDSYDIKMGPGGLVDVEFSAQFLQLSHGQSRPELRVGNTLVALERARAAGLLDAGAHATLDGGYRFLRRLEHRMRMDRAGTQVLLPRAPARADALARRVGLPSGQALLDVYQSTARAVRACFTALVATP